jgi:hypothetical protein
MRMWAVLLSVLLVSLLSSCGPSKPDYDAAYDRIKPGMSVPEVTAIVGEGRPTSIDVMSHPPICRPIAASALPSHGCRPEKF